MILGRAFALLRSNPSIAVPGLAVALVLALVQFALTPADPLDDDLARRLLRSIAQVLATILSIACTTGMADTAWSSGRTRLADGARAFRTSGGHVFVAAGALFVLGAIAALLAPFTFGLSFLTYAYFCIYTMASAVSGERPGLRAVAESVDIAFRRPLSTLGIALAIAAVAIAAGSLATLIAGTPFVGPLAADLVIQFVVAYVALVVVGEYRILRRTGVPA